MEQLQRLCSSSRIYDISELDRQRKVSLNGTKGNRTLRPARYLWFNIVTGLYLDMTEYVKTVGVMTNIGPEHWFNQD